MKNLSLSLLKAYAIVLGVYAIAVTAATIIKYAIL